MVSPLILSFNSNLYFPNTLIEVNLESDINNPVEINLPFLNTESFSPTLNAANV